MSQDNENIALVKDLYAAFAQGNVAPILNAVSANVAWGTVGRAADYEGFGPRTGRDGVAEFFQTTGANFDFEYFTPQDFIASDGKVVVLGRYAMTMKKNGRRLESDWVHVFDIRDGVVHDFKEFTDTAQAVEASRG